MFEQDNENSHLHEGVTKEKSAMFFLFPCHVWFPEGSVVALSLFAIQNMVKTGESQQNGSGCTSKLFPRLT